MLNGMTLSYRISNFAKICQEIWKVPVQISLCPQVSRSHSAYMQNFQTEIRQNPPDDLAADTMLRTGVVSTYDVPVFLLRK